MHAYTYNLIVGVSLIYQYIATAINVMLCFPPLATVQSTDCDVL